MSISPPVEYLHTHAYLSARTLIHAHTHTGRSNFDNTVGADDLTSSFVRLAFLNTIVVAFVKNRALVV